MKTVGLITEYNPFHNGHLHHLLEAKKICNADYAVVVMSGNFVQRGAPALIDKYTRAKMALECGADLVLELPVSYATASAEYFAMGSVSILNSLGVVTDICFGSESGDITLLKQAALLLSAESEQFRSHLKQQLKSGLSYPLARANAFSKLLHTAAQGQDNKSFTSPMLDADELNTIIASPNNILGIEYIKALNKFGSNINPVTISRKTTGYHDTTLDYAISSATAIRLSLKNNNTVEEFNKNVPHAVYRLLEEKYLQSFPIFEDDFSSLLYFKLLQEDSSTLGNYLDVSEGIGRRIMKERSKPISFGELATTVKSKQYTLTRINRALIHILLNITTSSMNDFNQSGYAQYARILGFKRSSASLLRQIQDKASIPVITKVADGRKNLDGIGLEMLEQDILASDLYNQIVYSKFGSTIKNDYLHNIVISD